jgi:hypothetical protein
MAFFTLYGGGSGGGTSTVTKDYSPNQDRLAGVQADISQNLANLSFQNLPTYTANSANMVQDAMDGTLSSQMRQQAGNDATAATGAALESNNRNMQRYGMGFNANRLLSENNRNAIMGAANKAGSMNQAAIGAEDMKWNRNAGAFGQSTMMSNGAMSGMNAAAGQYGNMAAGASQNSARNAAGLGAAGASMGAAMFKADGGYIEKKGLKMASGGRVQPLQIAPIDWRNQPSGESSSSSKSNSFGKQVGYFLSGAAPSVAGYALKGVGSEAWKYGKGKFSEWSLADKQKAGHNAEANQKDYPYAEETPKVDPVQADTSSSLPVDSTSTITTTDVPVDTTSTTDAVGPATESVDWTAQSAADASWLDAGFKNGGMVKKSGLKLAAGGMATINTPYNSGSYVSSTTTREDNGQNPYVKQAETTAISQGTKYAVDKAFAPPANNPTSLPAETPGTATVSPVEAPAQVTEVPLQDAPVEAPTQAVEAPAPDVSSAPVEAPVSDVATEAGANLGTDAAADVTANAGTDAVTNAATDTATTAATDAGANVATTAATDAATTAATDAAATTATTAATDAAATAGTTAVADAAATALAAEAASTVAGTAVGTAAGAAGGVAAGAGGGAAAGATAGSVVPGIGTAIGALAGIAASQFLAEGGDVQRTDMKPGGEVSGPGTETSDDIPAWLSDGEFVLNAEAVKMVGKDKLDKINNAGLEKRKNKFACGGAVKHGIKLAGGGFLGGNLGIAMGAGVEQYNRQQMIDQHQQQLDMQKQRDAREQKQFDWATAEQERKDLERSTMINIGKRESATAESANAIPKDHLAKAQDEAKANAAISGQQYEPMTQEQVDVFNKVAKPDMASFEKERIAAWNNLGETAKAEAYRASMKAKGANDELVDLLSRKAPQSDIDAAFAKLNPVEALKQRNLLNIYDSKREAAIEKNNRDWENRFALSSQNSEQRMAQALAKATGASKGTGASGGAGEWKMNDVTGGIDTIVGKDGESAVVRKVDGKDVPVPRSEVVSETWANINALGESGMPLAAAIPIAHKMAVRNLTGQGKDYAPTATFDPKTGKVFMSVTDDKGRAYQWGGNRQISDNELGRFSGGKEVVEARAKDRAQRQASIFERADKDSEVKESVMRELGVSTEDDYQMARAKAISEAQKFDPVAQEIEQRIAAEQSKSSSASSKKQPPNDRSRWFDTDLPTDSVNEDGVPNVAKNAYSKAFNMFADSARKATQ